MIGADRAAPSKPKRTTAVPSAVERSTAMNVVTFTGRVKDDPVRKDTKHGVVAEWVLAVDGKNREWISVEAWGRLAGTCASYLRAGRRVAVTGELHTKQWNDSDGTRHKTWYVQGRDVTFLDSPTDNTPEPSSSKVPTEAPTR